MPRITLSLLSALLLSCTGVVVEPAGGLAGANGIESCSAAAAEPAATPMRQLSAIEYQRSVFDLFGVEVETSGYPVSDGRFDNDVTGASVTPALADHLQRQAEHVASAIVTDPDELERVVGCAPVDDACAGAFIRDMGRRALRRPLSESEQAACFELYAWGRDATGPARGIEVLIQAFLQDPAFVHRMERGEPGAADDYEIATRLSYFLVRSTPDEALLDAAERGALSDAEGLKAEVQRLLGEPRAVESMVDFYRQWLGLRVTGVSKDPAAYPDFSPELLASMAAQRDRFLRDLVERDAPFSELYAAHYTFVDARLAQYYGIEGSFGETLERVELDPERSAGILTSPLLLTRYGLTDQSDPIRRGLLIRDRVLCQPLPPPPPVIPSTPIAAPDASRREQIDALTSVSPCASCHTFINPPGFLFEGFDGTGRARTEDGGHPVDSHATITTPASLAGEYDGIVEFAAALAESEVAERCAAMSWAQFAAGREVDVAEACALSERLPGEGATRLSDFVIAVVSDERFVLRVPDETELGEP